MKYLFLFVTLFLCSVFAQNSLDNTEWKLTSYFYEGEYVTIPNNEEVEEVLISFQNNEFSTWVCGGIVGTFNIQEESPFDRILIIEMTEYLVSCSPFIPDFQTQYFNFFYDFEWNNGSFTYEINNNTLILRDPYANVATYDRNSLGMNSIQNTDEVYIYPNPVRENLFIKGLKDAKFNYNIYSAHGSLIKTGAANHSTIKVGSLETGTYILEIQIENKTQKVKFIKK